MGSPQLSTFPRYQRTVINSWESICVVWIASWASQVFFMEYHFYFKELFRDKLCLFRLGYLTVIFSKMNKVCFSLQRRQLTVFVANDKVQTFKQMSEFWKISVYHLILKNFFRDHSDINKCDLGGLYNEICEHLEDLHNWVN